MIDPTNVVLGTGVMAMGLGAFTLVMSIYGIYLGWKQAKVYDIQKEMLEEIKKLNKHLGGNK